MILMMHKRAAEFWAKRGRKRENRDDEEEDDSTKEMNQRRNLREFVYLNQVSVVSLLASLEGGIKQEETAQRTESTEETVSGEVSASISGIGANVRGQEVALNEDTTEEVRNYVTQSLFTELHSHPQAKPKIDEHNLKQDEEIDSVSTADIGRGDIVRVDVELSTHYIYKFFKAFQHISESVPESIGAEEEQMLDLFESLFEKYIPVTGIVKNYEMWDGKIVPCNEQEEEGQSIVIVGHLDKENLWTDESQILFDDDVFTVYCRVEQIRENRQWYPLSLSQTIESISPPMAASLNDFVERASSAVKEGMEQMDSTDYQNQEIMFLDKWKDMFEEYDNNVQGIDVSEDERNEAVLRIVSEFGIKAPESMDINERKQVLRRYAKYLRKHFNANLSSEDEAHFRNQVFNNQISSGLDVSTKSNEDSMDGFIIESNFIAIYW